MTSDNLVMRMVADVVNVPVERPMVVETVSLGAAYAAGLAVGYWAGLEGLRRNWHRAARWVPAMEPARRAAEYDNRKRAVERTFDWIRAGEDPAAPR
jgi:glycerol kinase